MLTVGLPCDAVEGLWLTSPTVCSTSFGASVASICCTCKFVISRNGHSTTLIREWSWWFEQNFRSGCRHWKLADAYRMSYLPRDLRHITTCDSTRLLQAQYLKSLHSVKLFCAQSLLLVLCSFDQKAMSSYLRIHFPLSESYENKLHQVLRRQWSIPLSIQKRRTSYTDVKGLRISCKSVSRCSDDILLWCPFYFLFICFRWHTWQCV